MATALTTIGWLLLCGGILLYVHKRFFAIPEKTESQRRERLRDEWLAGTLVVEAKGGESVVSNGRTTQTQ